LNFKSTLAATISVILIQLSVSVPKVAIAIPAQGQKIMVAGPSPDSIAIVRRIYSLGGNVVDASVAVAFGLAVTHPYYAALGGGGFALFKQGSQVKALDFREMAPAATNADLFQKLTPSSSTEGGLAVGVPGIVAGLWALHQESGKLKWAVLLDDAIRLAEKGFLVSGEWVFLTDRNLHRFNDAGKTAFTRSDRKPLRPGDTLRQPGLARLLRAIAQKGPSAFYSGVTAKEIVQTVNSSGGIFTSQDLTNYKVRWLEPQTEEFAGHKVYLMPPPSSGGTVISQALRLMTKIGLQSGTPLSANEFHWLIEIQKMSFRGRALLGDPDFVKNPLDHLRSDTYLNPMAAMFRMDKSISETQLAAPSPTPGVNESENTTHFSIMDAAGNAVAMTITLNGDYGSGLVTPKSGISLNNEMDDFTTRPGQPNMFGLIQGESNLVRPGARPLSSMSPTLVEKNGRIVMSLGAPGGPRIISSVLQVLYRALTQPFDLDQLIQAPRVHHQFRPNSVRVDNFKISPETMAALRSRGHQIETASTGKVYAIRLDSSGLLEAAFDSRGEGAAGGL
jgi:gamma-glutamyltranspeptidase/glutathione hydrolase